MPRRNALLTFAAFGLVALFLVLLVQLLLLRYERGDVYSPYSTLRSDPLGTRAFYEALESTGRYTVERGFRSIHRETEAKPNAILLLGLDSSEVLSFTKDEITDLDNYVSGGGRVIMTFSPEDPFSSTSDSLKKTGEKKDNDSGSDKDDKNSDRNADKPVDGAKPETQQEKSERDDLRREQKAQDDSDKDGDKVPLEYHPSLAALWGFGLQRHSDSENKKKDESNGLSTAPPEAELPEVMAWSSSYGGVEGSVPWKSAGYFVRLEPEWQPIYVAKGEPVMIRRHWGQGDVLVSTDSYFLSNEALRNDRRPLLLSLVAGWPGRLVFDEAHLGTEEDEGIMSLTKKFRLEGFLYGMLAVAGLFLWRNSVPLVPPRATDGRAPLGGAISGKDSRSGLVNLLRRNIPASEILHVCLAEWKRAVTPGRPRPSSQISEMESIVAATSAQPGPIVQSYHDLRNLNSPGKAQGIHATKS